jgi:transcription elongation factor GreA
METFYLSKGGYEKLKAQLDYLMKDKRKEIANALAHARAFGDLSENAEYQAAKDSQAINETRVRELTEKLAAARIVDESTLSTDKVCLGSIVLLKDLKYNEEIEYSLVSEVEADFDKNKISISSPVGKGLVGKKTGDITEIKVPSGILKYEILKVSR